MYLSELKALHVSQLIEMALALDIENAKDTLKNLHRVWRRPVHLETVDEGRDRLLSYDGSEHKVTRL